MERHHLITTMTNMQLSKTEPICPCRCKLIPSESLWIHGDLIQKSNCFAFTPTQTRLSVWDHFCDTVRSWLSHHAKKTNKTKIRLLTVSFPEAVPWCLYQYLLSGAGESQDCFTCCSPEIFSKEIQHWGRQSQVHCPGPFLTNDVSI